MMTMVHNDHSNDHQYLCYSYKISGFFQQLSVSPEFKEELAGELCYTGIFQYHQLILQIHTTKLTNTYSDAQNTFLNHI